MERIAEKLKELGNRILEWWNRFTAKQKTLIVSVVALLVIAIVVIVSVLMKPKYVLLRECETTKEAAEVRDLLEADGYHYEITDDGLTISIVAEEVGRANLLLGANNIQAAGYGIENVTDGSFSTTESDKQKKHVKYLEEQLSNDFLSMFTAIKRARVKLNIPEDNGTLIAKEEESSAWVQLELKDEFTQENAAYLARAIATALGNKTTNNIVILDTEGNMLFTGDENYSASGLANAQLSVKGEAEKNMINNVRRVILGTNEFDNVEVSPNLVLDFSNQKKTTHTYTPAEGQTQGVLSHEDIFNSENISGIGGVPGTDSNDDDSTYVMEDNNRSQSTQSEESRDYLPNEEITTIETPSGVINYGASSLAASLIRYNVIREEDAKAQGFLDGISWEEYKLNNAERTRIELDESFLTVVSNATGIATNNITLIAYSENLFFDAEGSAITATDVVQILLIILILALLAFVVLRSMRSEKHEEEEEELSVETLLQSNVQLEEISSENESEEKRLVIKFVEENPEAAANLLRNWLNEDWG
ncbi:MAG: flagellar M-ring protein FliF [Lachnospiraceae bacterium]|nr:flagellar M-ring protein FliF [Lachnospiraceae bacterium]